MSRVLEFLVEMHASVQRRDQHLQLETCRQYLRLLSDDLLADYFYNPVIEGVRYTYAGNNCRIVHGCKGSTPLFLRCEPDPRPPWSGTMLTM